MACAHHPDVPEAFACTHCAARLCAACVGRVGLSHRYCCGDCGHEARATIPARGERSLAADVVGRVVSREGFATAFAFAIFFALSFLFTALVVFYFAALVAYYFAIVRHVGMGKPGLPGPSDASEDWIEIGGFVLRGMLCTALAVAPLLIWFAITREAPSPAIAVVLVAIGQLYAPAMLLAVASSDTAFATLWPVAWVQIIARTPRAYARFLALWTVTLVVGFVVVAITEPLVELDMPGMLPAAFLWNAYWFAQAVLVGDFLRSNAEALGFE